MVELFLKGQMDVQKLVFLRKTSDAKIPGILGGMIELDEKYSTQSAAELFAHYDVVNCDIGKYKKWYSENKNSILGMANCRVIFLHPTHVPVSVAIKKKLSDEWKVHSLVKEFPKLFISKADLIQKILSGHISNLDLDVEEAASCCINLGKALKNLL